MKDHFIAPIVEGHGEVQAVPILLQRIFREVHPCGQLKVNPPLRIKTGSFLNDDEYFGRYVTLAVLKAQAHPQGSVLILLDCDDDCPGTLGPRLLAGARQVQQGVPIVVALAYREYETWFVAAASSLSGIGGLPERLEAPPEPEKYRDAKGWINSHMGHPYNAPDHQPLLTRRFSFEEAACVPSFARLHRKLHQLFSSSLPN